MKFDSCVVQVEINENTENKSFSAQDVRFRAGEVVQSWRYRGSMLKERLARTERDDFRPWMHAAEKSQGHVTSFRFIGVVMPPQSVRGQSTCRPDNVEGWTLARSFINTSHGQIAIHDIGVGPALLLIHGFPLNAYHWRDVMSCLASERRCIAPDLLGLGYTRPKMGSPVHAAAQAEMLAELLRTLGIDQTDIISNDSGTAVAQLLAARYPHLVRSMLITNGDVEPDSPPEPLIPAIQLAQQGVFAQAVIGATIADKERARSSDGLIGLTFTHPDRVSDETIDLYLAPLVESPERMELTNRYASSLLPNPLVGIGRELRQTAIPTSILWGTSDRFFKQSNVDYLQSVMPNVVNVRRVEGGALFFPEEFPTVVAEAARDLWSAFQPVGCRGI